MLVGEQPGDQEDRQGRPFVGPAGQLLDRALAELGWPRDALYVTNAVKHFKFEMRGKRRMHKTPGAARGRCLPALARERDRACAARRPSSRSARPRRAQLLGRAVPVMAQRGQWLEREDGLRVLVTLHPSALLRLVGEDRDAAYEQWLADLRHAAAVMRKGR